ncbi:MAG: nitroreductase family protein [Paludibacteraceae bacterium]|nr:nitroreductase family protein [Paludibacteraceae bacterium]
MQSFFELLQNRRSIRKYEERNIDDTLLNQILTAALMSPAGKRLNPWEFVVVQERETLQKLSDARPAGSQLLANSALGIVVIADKERSDTWMEDASIAAHNIQLAATDLGLGACWVQIQRRERNEQQTAEEYVKELLNIPAQYAVLCVISIGYKNEDRKPYDLNKLDYSKIHHEQF